MGLPFTCKPFTCAVGKFRVFSVTPPPRLLHACDCSRAGTRREQSPRECCLELVRPRLTVSGPRLTVSGPTPPDLASVARLVWSLSPATSSCSQHPRQRLALAPLPQHHALAFALHPSHTRPCIRRPDVNALECVQDEKQAHQIDPRQAGAQNSHRAYSVWPRAPRAPITTRLTYLSPMRRRWVAPFCSSGLPPSA